MSIPGSSLIIAAIEAGGIILLQSLAGKVPRSIAGIKAQVTIEERSLDQMTITQHPVEQGASIGDHAFKRPAKLLVRAAWSNTPSPANTGLINIPGNLFSGLASTLNAFAGPASYVQSVYAQLLAIQESAVPFTVITGKRIYNNMLFSTLSQTTDEKFENALLITAEFEQIIIVSTQVVSSVPPRDVQRTPQLNAPVQNNGSIQLQDAPNFNANGAG